MNSIHSNRRRAFVAVLVMSGTLGGMLIAEICSRILTAPRRGISWYTYDPRFDFRHRSNHDAWTNEWGARRFWRYKTNSRGFRGDEWPDVPAAGTRRVVVAGDSFTFGNGLNEYQTFPRIAHNQLQKRGQNWEVINLGTSAWGPNNALAYLETEGAGISGSCLVYAFYTGNDVMDGMKSRLYQLDGATLQKVPLRQVNARVAGIRTFARLFPAYDILLEHSQLFNVVRELTLDWMGVKPPKRASQTATNRPETPPDFDIALRLNEAVLTRMEALGRSRFGRFVLLIVPSLDQIVPAPDLPASEHAMLEKSTQSVRDWCKRRGVSCVDLTETFSHRKDVTDLYFPRDLDFHLNGRGCKVAGETLARALPDLFDRAHAP